jgi:predicted nucleotidyltransferase
MKLQKPDKLATVFYHDVFDYPLSNDDLLMWKVGNKHQVSRLLKPSAGGQANIGCWVESAKGFFFKNGRENLIGKRIVSEKISVKKLELARKAGKVLSFVSTIKMVAVTGSLAMKNADKDSDIDLMIITQKGTLWTTRGICLLLKFLGFPIRTGRKDRKDKLCINMWLDESNLVWPETDRNIYTAHEIAQIVPLVDKNRSYGSFLDKNRWILGWWPNAIKIRNPNIEILNNIKMQNSKFETFFRIYKIGICNLFRIFEPIAFRIQYFYMKSKITREVVTPTRAVFHPNDLGKMVKRKLGVYFN